MSIDVTMIYSLHTFILCVILCRTDKPVNITSALSMCNKAAFENVHILLRVSNRIFLHSGYILIFNGCLTTFSDICNPACNNMRRRAIFLNSQLSEELPSSHNGRGETKWPCSDAHSPRIHQSFARGQIHRLCY